MSPFSSSPVTEGSSILGQKKSGEKNEKNEPNNEERESFLATIPLFQGVESDGKKAIAEVLIVKEYGLGEQVVRIGTEEEGLFLIWRGKAAVAPKAHESSERPTLVLQEGDFFGQPFVGPTKNFHRADVIAITPLICLLLRHVAVVRLGRVIPWLEDFVFSEEPPVIEKILELENLEVDLTRAITPPEGNLYPRVFGGQLLGQALAAAFRSVDESLMVHSLHSYFLVAGDPKVPIVYQVTRVRDGTSFAVRQVIATQKGRSIFSMHASFQRAEEGLEHQAPMPSGCPPPNEVPSWDSIQLSYLFDARIPMEVRRKYARNKKSQMPIDLRFCSPIDELDPGKRDPRQLVWMKSRGKLQDRPSLHPCVVAYASDFTFLKTALLPHGITTPNPKLVMSSLDHCMWFHRPFRADDWLLYQIESPRSSGSRGFCVGRIYTKNGELVASVAQEGLIRVSGKTFSTLSIENNVSERNGIMGTDKNEDENKERNNDRELVLDKDLLKEKGELKFTVHSKL